MLKVHNIIILSHSVYTEYILKYYTNVENGLLIIMKRCFVNISDQFVKALYDKNNNI